jgi:hypothetical protein
MPFSILNTTIVLTGKGFDPTRFNIEYLRAKEIIPPDWSAPENPFVTPIIANAMFSNGASLIVQQERIQIGWAGTAIDPLETGLENFARSLVQDQEKYVYTGIGLNFHGLFQVDHPEEFIRDKFSIPMTRIKKIQMSEIDILGFSGKRPYGTGHFSLSSVRFVDTDKVNKEGIVFNSNYDCKLGDPGDSKSAIRVIDSFREAAKDFASIAKNIFDE